MTPPKCHPRTRRAVLRKIIDRVNDLDRVALFLCLYGPAGAGKSTIAQTIAELLEKAGLVAAAFFFCRNALTGCNDKTPLVVTLVRLDLDKCAASSSHHHKPALFQHCEHVYKIHLSAHKHKMQHDYDYIALYPNRDPPTE